MSPQPLNAAEALAMTQAGLSFLATGEAAELPTALQAEVLTGLEQAEARLTAARSAVLAGFCAGHGYEADGQYRAQALAAGLHPHHRRRRDRRAGLGASPAGPSGRSRRTGHRDHHHLLGPGDLHLDRPAAH